MDISDVVGAGKLANSELAKKIYEDGLSGAVEQTGDTITDIVKTARWTLAPITYLAAWHDRFARYCKRISDNVPLERQIDPAPQVFLPLVSDLRYLEEESPLTTLYLNLLEKAIDNKFAGTVHPSFIKILPQIAPEEVLILEHLRSEPIQTKAYYYFDGFGSFYLENPISFSFDCTDFTMPWPFYIDHLEKLGLADAKAGQPNEKTEDPKRLILGGKVSLTFFGRAFLKACGPSV
jgi:hypothetical protein